MKKQNIIVVGIIAFILTVAVGYALFSETLTISGTATAEGTFDVEFRSHCTYFGYSTFIIIDKSYNTSGR